MSAGSTHARGFSYLHVLSMRNSSDHLVGSAEAKSFTLGLSPVSNSNMTRPLCSEKKEEGTYSQSGVCMRACARE